MKIAYLILAHANPGHLGRLVRRLSSEASACFIHIDKKSDLADFSHVQGEHVVYAKKRVPVYWADYSAIDATLHLMRMALGHPGNFDRLVLLSGTDYPVRSSSYIERFFERNRSAEFMDFVQMPADDEGKPITRLTKYIPRSYNSRIARRVEKALLRRGFIPRYRDYKKYLGDLVPYAGSQWWALSRDACQFIQTFVAGAPRMTSFFRNTHCPDEMFFQIILGNSLFKRRIRRCLTYTDWSAGGANPAWISERHMDFLRSTATFEPHPVFGDGEILFARKFSDEAEGLVTELDQIIRERDGG